MSEKTAVASGEQEPAEELRRLQALVEDGRVEAARTLVTELAARCPESEGVRQWARVLAPPRIVGAQPASGSGLEAERRWLRAHAAEYPGCWLALDGDRLIAADADLKNVRSSLDHEGLSGVLLHYQPAPRE